MANLEGCTIQCCGHVVVLVPLDGRSIEAGNSLDEVDEKYSLSCAGRMRNMLICSICKAKHNDEADELTSPQVRLITMVAAPHTAEHACNA